MLRTDRIPQQPMALLARRLKICGVSLQGEINELRRYPAGAAPELGDRPDQLTLLVSGWAAEAVQLEDGRRQIVDLLAPGDILSPALLQGELVVLTSGSAAEFRLVGGGAEEAEHGLADLLEAQRRTREGRLMEAVVNLGRRSAYERLAHLLLAAHDRLLDVGMAQPDSFHFPLTQETLADTLGLSIVHVNRTLQLLRGEGRLVLQSGRAAFSNRQALATAVSYIRPGVGRVAGDVRRMSA
jgi:CRP-like cAMP-binding protein